MSLALSICVLFVSLMQLVNGAQFLSITFLSQLLATPAAIATTDKVPLTSMHASL